MKLTTASSLGGSALALALSVICTGCSSSLVTTKQYSSTDTTGMNGVVYSLPKQMLLIKITRDKVDREKLIKAVTDLTTKLDAENAKLRAAKTRTSDLNAKLALANDAEKQKLQAEKDLADLEVRFIDIGVKKLIVDLESSKQQLARLPEDEITWQDVVSCELQSPVPDPNWTFVANLSHSWTRSDDLKITTTDSGLLQGYIGTADDKTSEIVVKVIETAARLASSQFSPMGFEKDNYPARLKEDEKPFKYERLIDPSSDCDWAEVMADLDKLKAPYKFTLSAATQIATRRDQIAEPVNGLLYRRPVMRTLIVKLDNDYVLSKQLLLLNQGPVAALDLKASRGVVTKHEFAFKDGSLISFAENRPSEGLAYVSIPANALRAIVSIPAELIQLKIDYSSKETALAKAETEYLKAQLDLLAAQQTAEAAKNPTE